MTDYYLLDAGWLFFAAWSVIVLWVSWAAFAQDLFPGKTNLELDKKSRSRNPTDLDQSGTS
jgi:hypothetical protein